GDVEELDHLGRDRLAALAERLDLARVDDLDDLVLDRRADPGQLLRLAVERELRDRTAGLAYARCRAAVGENPKGRLAFDLQQIGQQLELLGHLRVARERRRHHGDDTGVRPLVCVPTYNERENLERMVRALGDLGVSVLVIDDSSPDGTGELADRLARELDHVEVLHRERKEGLGPAYLAGFRHALAAGAELILEMDCDFSHDPADVPRLLAAAEEADLAVGSRYVEGGSVHNWGLLRRLVSAGGSLYAR